jgi:SRSO17 transposase
MASLESFGFLAERFMDFCDTYSSFFKAARHNLSAKARCYLSGLLMKGERKNMERMEDYVQDYDYQSLQQFVSDSPWDHEALIERIGKDVDVLLGGKDSMLIIDESGFAKKGKKSVGVARQWNGRQGKVDNAQVGVFAALSDGKGAGGGCSLVDTRLYLPEEWTEDTERCEKAKIPEDKREFKTKPQLAWEMIESAQSGGLRFGWVGLDSLYGNAPELLRNIDDAGLLFTADVHCDQHIYGKDPEPYLPERTGKVGRTPSRLKSLSQSERIDTFFKGPPAPEWQKVFVRDSTKGRIELQASARRVWLWDAQEQESRQWWAVCVIDSDTAERKFFLSNAPASISLAELVRKHAGRYWIERSFQDAKTSVGMADYQARGWVAWHHHMALVMLALLFLLKERKFHAKTLDLLSCQDIVALLDIYLPRVDRTKQAVIDSMNRRHAKRRAAIQSARRRAALNKEREINLTK